MKKVMSLILASALALPLVISGCGSQGGKVGQTEKSNQGVTTNAAAEATDVSGPGEFPIVKEKIQLKILVPKQSSVIDYEDNDATRWLEDITNIDLVFEDGGENVSEKVNLLLASDSELPDIFLTYQDISNDQLVAYGEQGVFLPINDYIDKWGVNFKKALAYNPDIIKNITAPNGKIYTVPFYNEGQHTLHSQKFWLNQKWLNNVGMKLPDTPDELYEVLMAFKNNDCNGNGKADEIPLIATTGYQADLMGYLMTPFITSTGKDKDYLYFDNGKIVTAISQPGWKEGLKYLKKLYGEGLLDKEAFTMKAADAKPLVAAPEGNRVGAFTAGAMSNIVVIATPGPRDEYVTLPPLKNANGERKSPYFKATALPAFIITKYCKYPAEAFRLADLLMTDPVENAEIRNFQYGPEGQGWRKAKDGETGLSGKQAEWAMLYVWGEPTKWNWKNLGNLFVTKEDKGLMAYDPSVFNQEKILWDATEKNYEPYSVDVCVPTLLMNKDEAQEVADVKSAIKSFVEEQNAKFVLGTRDIDTDWESYLSELEKLGLSGYLKNLQTIYERQYK